MGKVEVVKNIFLTGQRVWSRLRLTKCYLLRTNRPKLGENVVPGEKGAARQDSCHLTVHQLLGNNQRRRPLHRKSFEAPGRWL